MIGRFRMDKTTPVYPFYCNNNNNIGFGIRTIDIIIINFNKNRKVEQTLRTIVTNECCERRKTHNNNLNHVNICMYMYTLLYSWYVCFDVIPFCVVVVVGKIGDETGTQKLVRNKNKKGRKRSKKK